MSLCLLSSHKKVGRGAGRSARISGDAGAASPAYLPGRGAERLQVGAGTAVPQKPRVWELCSHL